MTGFYMRTFYNAVLAFPFEFVVFLFPDDVTWGSLKRKRGWSQEGLPFSRTAERLQYLCDHFHSLSEYNCNVEPNASFSNINLVDSQSFN